MLGVVFYWRANQLALGARGVALPPSAEVVYEHGQPGRFEFAGNHSLYFRYALAPGPPDEVCESLAHELGTGFRPYETSPGNPRPCEWEGSSWGARVRIAVLEVDKLVPNNHPIVVPEGFSLVCVVAD